MPSVVTVYSQLASTGSASSSCRLVADQPRRLARVALGRTRAWRAMPSTLRLPASGRRCSIGRPVRRGQPRPRATRIVVGCTSNSTRAFSSFAARPIRAPSAASREASSGRPPSSASIACHIGRYHAYASRRRSSARRPCASIACSAAGRSPSSRRSTTRQLMPCSSASRSPRRPGRLDELVRDGETLDDV